MKFEIKLQDSPSAYILLNAGIEVEDLFDVWHDVVIYKKRKLPIKLAGEYFNSDPPAKVQLNFFAFDPTHVEIDAHDKIAPAIRKVLTRYSLENDGKALAEREHHELWAKIEKLLKRDDLSYDKLRYHKGVLTPGAIKGLLEVAEGVDACARNGIYRLFDKRSVPKSEQAGLVKWLVDRFDRTRDPREEIGVPLQEFSCRHVAENLIRLIKNKKLRGRRWVLCVPLARTKHPKAADAIATLFGDGVNTRGALQALAMLPSHDHVEKIKPFLRRGDSEVRRQAKKTLEKLGVKVAIKPPPPPVHLVKGKRAIPKGLEEWSANLDFDELVPTLKKVAKQIKSGFTDTEIAEVEGVAESMKPEQTRTLRFPITIAGKGKSNLWIVIFMDDVDAPDVEIHGDAALISKL